MVSSIHQQALDNILMPSLREKQTQAVIKLQPRSAPEVALPRGHSTISYFAGYHVGGLQRTADKRRTKVDMEEFVASLLKDTEEFYFEICGRTGIQACPELIKFMDLIVTETEPHLRKARLLALWESGFLEARWALKDSQELFEAWLQCLAEVLGESTTTSGAGQTLDGTAPLAARLRSAIDRGRSTRLNDPGHELAARRDPDLCTVRSMQVQMLSRQIWIVQKRRLAQLQAAMSAMLSKQLALRQGMKSTRAARAAEGAEETGAVDESESGSGKAAAAVEDFDPFIGDSGPEELEQFLYSKGATNQVMIHLITLIDSPNPTGLKRFTAVEHREHLFLEHGISVPDAMAQAAAEKRKERTEKDLQDKLKKQQQKELARSREAPLPEAQPASASSPAGEA